MQIVVTAGKGGTGKTTVATNFAIALSKEYNVQLLDCDVEEPDTHIFLNPEIKESEPVKIKHPEINESKCTHCGRCSEMCQFNALAVIGNETIFYPELCHGCGLCSLVCPEGAIEEVDHEIGIVEYGRAREFEFIQGELTVGDPLAPPIISELKKYINSEGVSILDSPPGTACPAVEAIHDSDFAILVTEPTPFGLNDLKLTVDICREMEIPFGVIINRDGIGNEGVEEYCRREGIPILMSIPDSRKIAELYAEGKPFVDEIEGWKDQFIELKQSIERELGRRIPKV